MSVVQDGLDLGFRQLTVASVDRLTADSVAITFDVPPELHEQFRFRAGQHLTLRRVIAGADVRRTYSVCSSAAGGPLRVAVKRLPGGALSSRIVESLRAGDVLDVLPPAGRFGPAVDPTRTRHYGLMAAGSGVTPLLSIACTVLDVEPQSEVTLLYANRTSAEVMFLDELAELKDRHPTRLQLLHVLSREQQEPELLSGRLDRDRVKRVLTTLVSADAIDEWYLCGPLTMVTGARQALHEAGVEPAAVHVELFFADPLPSRTPPPPRASTDLATVTVVLHGRASTVQVDPVGAPILDAVLAVRADAPYACRGGVCGTCRARCTVGAVSLAVNWALEPDELAAGVVLTCQAHPSTPEVRLEYL